MSDENVNQTNEELNEDELNDVAGGVIPVLLPIKNGDLMPNLQPDGSTKPGSDGNINFQDFHFSK